MRVYLKRLKKQKAKLFIARILIDLFVIIGMLAVLNWSINVFRDAGQFYIDQKANAKTEQGDARPVSVKDQPVKIADADQVAVARSPVSSETRATLLSDGSALSLPIEEKIETKFGKDGKLALAVARAESRLRADAINYNSNGTWDAGIFQINQVHGVSQKELLNPDTNIEVAFQLYKKSGNKFSCWVAYQNKSYLAFL